MVDVTGVTFLSLTICQTLPGTGFLMLFNDVTAVTLKQRQDDPMCCTALPATMYKLLSVLLGLFCK